MQQKVWGGCGERRTLYSDRKDGSWYKSFGENLVTNTACMLILLVVFNSLHEVAKVLEFQLQHHSLQKNLDLQIVAF